MSGISSIGSSTMMMPQLSRMQRPDPSKMANELFDKLDTSGQGYLDKSTLQSALGQTSSSSASSGSQSVDDLFAKLDSDSNGKVTKQEFSDTLSQMAQQLDQKFQSMRMQGAMSGMGGMPPPGPPPDANGGLSKDQLTSMAKDLSSSDSSAASRVSDLVSNFDKADTNQDGKVSAQEAVAYAQSSQSQDKSGSSTSTGGSQNGDSSLSTDQKLLQQIGQLMQAYGIGDHHHVQKQGESSTSSAISISV